MSLPKVEEIARKAYMEELITLAKKSIKFSKGLELNVNESREYERA